MKTITHDEIMKELIGEMERQHISKVETEYIMRHYEDIVAIEKLLFTHFDEDFDDGTSLDLAVLDNELKDFLLDDVSKNGNTDGLTEEENRLFDRVSIAFHNNKVQPYLYADICNAVGRFYNKALLCVEKASGGHSVIERLRYEHKYMNMVKYKTYDEYNRAIWKVGFDTNNKTKSIAVNDAREWFDKGMVRIMSNNLLEEMKTFVAEENGSFNAVVGCHDDLVSAFWLCIQGMKSGFWYPF